MESRMPRPAFTVVTGVVVALAFVGLGSRLLNRFIPKQTENRLFGERLEFLSRASIQKIDWKTPTVETFAEARRVDRPVLLFLGRSSNPYARELDNGVFQMGRVQAYLARNFLCIRIDVDAFPEYRSALLPVSRAILGIMPGCQLWVLDPNGEVLQMLPRNVALFARDENTMISALVEARNRFERASIPGQLDFRAAQRADERALLEPQRSPLPGFGEFGSRLASLVDRKEGGFGPDGPRILTPESWRYLLATGQMEEFSKSLDPVLSSPVVDLIDGGFFHGSRDNHWVEVEYDKSSVANAAMLRVLAISSVTREGPFDRYLAVRTFDALRHDFLSSMGVSCSRSSDAGVDGRSARSSFGVRSLRAALPEDVDRTWAQAFLGLVVETNPRMTPRLAESTVVTRPRLSKVLKLLELSAGPRPPRSGEGYADNTGYVIARMIEAARILDDHDRLQSALNAFDWMSPFRDGSGVVHSFASGGSEGRLSDYLAYSDVCLQHYLATGRYSSLRDGLSVLRTALTKFQIGRTGGLKMIDAVTSPTPEFVELPEISDGNGESAMAMALRLTNDYSRMLADQPGQVAELRRFVSSAAQNYASVAGAQGVSGAGFFLAAAAVFDDAFIVAVGPQAQELSDRAARQFPNRLCVPAFGEVRQDLQGRAAGIYVIRGESVMGPMTLEVAGKSCSAMLAPGG